MGLDLHSVPACKEQSEDATKINNGRTGPNLIPNQHKTKMITAIMAVTKLNLERKMLWTADGML